MYQGNVGDEEESYFEDDMENSEGYEGTGYETDEEYQAGDTEQKKCIDIKGENIHSCENEEIFYYGELSPEGYVAKVPVELTNVSVRIPVSSYITLPEPALEIKQINKKLKITQCLLLQGEYSYYGFGGGNDEINTMLLFIKGFVRKNIEYATRRCSNRKGVCGNIHFCTVDVPFEFTTPVNFNNGIAPVISEPDYSTQFQYSNRKKLKGPGFAEKDELISSDSSEFNQYSSERLNELPYCELVSNSIFEFDELLGRRRPKCVELPFEEKEFRRIEEKMIVLLTIKIMQRRLVLIPPEDDDYIDLRKSNDKAPVQSGKKAKQKKPGLEM